MAVDSKVFEMLKLNPGATLKWNRFQKKFVLCTKRSKPKLPGGKDVKHQGDMIYIEDVKIQRVQK